MNRQIKFRAVHTLTKHWFYEEHIVYHNDEWYEDWRAFENGRELNLDQVAVMQYTGLKDKNGTEIYEGDILQRGDVMRSKYVVRYGDFVYSPDFHHEVDCLGWYFEEVGVNDKYKDPLPYLIDMLDGCVIGNIFENPELLERSQ